MGSCGFFPFFSSSSRSFLTIISPLVSPVCVVDRALVKKPSEVRIYPMKLPLRGLLNGLLLCTLRWSYLSLPRKLDTLNPERMQGPSKRKRRDWATILYFSKSIREKRSVSSFPQPRECKTEITLTRAPPAQHHPGEYSKHQGWKEKPVQAMEFGYSLTSQSICFLTGLEVTGQSGVGRGLWLDRARFKSCLRYPGFWVPKQAIWCLWDSASCCIKWR